MEIPKLLRFNEGYLKKIGFMVHETLNFEYFMSLKIQLNYKNGFGWKVNWVHLGQWHRLQ